MPATPPKKIYRHYKGGLYEIVCEALLESDPSVTMIIYKPLYENPQGTLWARPSAVFFESVEVDEKSVPRFALVE